MMVEVLCVCRRPPAWVTDATADYAQRLGRHIGLKFRYLAPEREGAAGAMRCRDEGQRVLKSLRAGTHLVALDERGDEHTSAGLASALARWRERFAHVTFAIGGADGFDSAVLEQASERWSLSRLTLPHLLVQIVVAEQIYRAWSILEGHPYHRA